MTKIITCPLVGSHFRPPAKQIIASVPSGTQLWLRPEPENPYDSKAIQVLLDPAGIPEFCFADLDQALEGTGTDLTEVLASGLIQLGYVADSTGKVCVQSGLPGNGQLHEALPVGTEWSEVRATLGFAADGKPMVVVTVEA